MAPTKKHKMAKNEAFEPFIVNRLSNQIGCAMSEQLTDISKYPTRLEKKYPDMSGYNAIAKVLREVENVRSKIKRRSRYDQEISVKLLMKDMSKKSVENALKMTLRILDVSYIDHFIVSVKPFLEEAEHLAKNTNETKKSPLLKFLSHTKAEKARRKRKFTLVGLAEIWPALENLYDQGSIAKLGVSNIDALYFKNFYNSVSCPPKLLELSRSTTDKRNQSFFKFCYRHDVQLNDFDSPENASDDLDFEAVAGFGLDWTLIYKVKSKIDGEFVTKGYIAGASKMEAVSGN